MHGGTGAAPVMQEGERTALHRGALALRGMRTEAHWNLFCDGVATAVTRHVPGHALPMWRRDPRTAQDEAPRQAWKVLCAGCRAEIALEAKPMRLAKGWPKGKARQKHRDCVRGYLCPWAVRRAA